MDIVILNLAFICILFHWKSELERQSLFNSVNFAILILAIVRLFFVTDPIYYLIGMGLGLAIPLITLKMIPQANMGMGVLKLLVVSGLLMGPKHILITLLLSGLLCQVFDKFLRKNVSPENKREILKKYPSGISVLILIPFQLIAIGLGFV